MGLVLPCAAKINSSHLFLGGGLGGSLKEELSLAWLLNLETEVWTPITDLLHAGKGFFCVPFGQRKLMAVGGYLGRGHLIRVGLARFFRDLRFSGSLDLVIKMKTTYTGTYCMRT